MANARLEDFLFSAAHAQPSTLAVVDTTGGLTYRQFAVAVDDLAGRLRTSYPPGTRLLVLLPNSRALPIWAIACSAARLLPILADPKAMGSDLGHLMVGFRPSAVVGHEADARLNSLGRVENSDPDGVVVIASESAGPVSPALAATTPLLDAYAAICTSGSSGRTKAVLLSQRAWLTSARRLALALDLHPRETAIHASTLAHGAGLLFSATLLQAGTNVLLTHFRAGDFVAAAGAAGATATFLVPTMLFDLLKEPGFRQEALPTLRTINYSGGPVAPSLLVRAATLWGSALVQDYGLIEAPAPQLVLSRTDHVRIGTGSRPDLAMSSGRPVHAGELSISDDRGRPAGPGQTGVIALTGPTLMTGYLRPGGVDNSTVGGQRLLTGDLAVQDADGYVTILGRTSNLIATGGRKVAAEHVEATLGECDGVRQAAVVGVPDERWGERLIALLVVEPEAADVREAVNVVARERLAPHERPKAVFIVPSLPAGPTGKLLRQEISSMARELISRVER